MKGSAILSIIVSFAIAIYAMYTCNDILNALSLVKIEALKSDSCSVSSQCHGDCAHQEIKCKYTTALTEKEKEIKCAEIKTKIDAATLIFAKCEFSCKLYDNCKTLKSEVDCRPKELQDYKTTSFLDDIIDTVVDIIL